jgi:hypothetical protein
MKYSTLPKEELNKFKKRMPESETTLQFKKYIQELPENEIGHFVLDKKDSVKANTIKARLRRASQSLGITVQVKRYGDNEVVFWRE